MGPPDLMMVLPESASESHTEGGHPFRPLGSHESRLAH
ncbi:hypothetical protein CYFUS_001320 [Cystobacter fuscus]|uniref:Uncharacterized protein n=1 Tax=Cystobacter fuscus TaxID=43 RepID=A0A250IYB3_9BACT|nr:hypothetical protein CYFUS_001320 [Cystobacter fuscus]